MLIDTKTIRYSQYDFKSVRASVGRNAIHDYPAMLHSNVVDSLIKEFCPQDGIIYDPFCGSLNRSLKDIAITFNCMIFV